MSDFHGELDVRYLGNDRWLLLSPFEFHLGSPDGAEYVRVGAGFVTDFASIPRILWSVMHPTGKSGRAAVIHDCAYRCGYVSVTDGSIRWITRAEADRIFLDAMEVLGVGWLSRRLQYRAVRIGGGHAWMKHRKAQGHDVETTT